MILSLSIQNFALIEQLKMDFSSGLSIITGETGAGKSILLGALELVLGKRADLTTLKNSDEKCVIEAHFDISSYGLHDFFQTHDLDYEPVSILRREILTSGKSRAFVNDTPVNLTVLQSLAESLIDIHSQAESQALTEIQYQYNLLDSFAGNSYELTQYQQWLKQYKAKVRELEQLEYDLKQVRQEFDYHQFLWQELQQLDLENLNQAALESELEQLTHVEFIKEQLQRAHHLTQEEQYGLLNSLYEMKLSLQKIAGFSPVYEQFFSRVESVLIELKDIASEIDQSAEQLVSDPQKAEEIQQKLQSLYQVQKKHQVSSVAELLEIQQDLAQKVLQVDQADTMLAQLQTDIDAAQQELEHWAEAIRTKRLQAAGDLALEMQSIWSQLGMPNARLKIEITPVEEYFSNGKDRLAFLFSANLGGNFGLLSKVASGGELSRIMLSAKATLAKYTQLPTLIFDEIDTGVSGEIAHRMGDIMKQMSQHMQVMSITHLPQIAAKGDQHFKVYKTVSNQKTVTALKLLDYPQRVHEIAQMLSGQEVSESALNHAKSLLN